VLVGGRRKGRKEELDEGVERRLAVDGLGDVWEVGIGLDSCLRVIVN
jgi:hypothetical protein